MPSTKKLDDPRLRERLLDLIRSGSGRYEACSAVGLSTSTFREYYKTNEDFREEIEDALNASVEPVIKVLGQLAKEGDVTAAKEFLKHQAPPPRSEADRNKGSIDIKVTHEIDAGKINSIAELQARVEQRKQAALEAARYDEDEIIEVPWTEGDEDE